MEEMANSSSSPKFDSGKIESIRQSNNSLSSVDLAVSVKDARFSYGRSNETAVLQETNLRIPKSAIYVLLGPSGCGKTTLLKALSNLIKLDDGEILVFGKKPGSKESKVPGSDLGYMPQEVALYFQLTVEEAIILFGKLHAVKKAVMYGRLESLTKLLDLPNKSRLISKLSGGQMRRVSMACAMINNPKLLVLDEPTVGVDPLLRESIWNLMIGLTKTEGTTILITTHYIEEAKNADLIGLMRSGRILREANPYHLMEELMCLSLEQCFIEICKMDNNLGITKEVKTESKYFPSVFKNKQHSTSKETNLEETVKYDRKSIKINRLSMKKIFDSDHNLENQETLSSSKENIIKIQALFWRNHILMRRNWPFLLYILGMPGVQIVLFCLLVGSDLSHLPVAVINDERPRLMSTLFTEKLDNSTLTQHHFNDISQAINSVENGKNWAALHIPRNFTQCLFKKLQLGLRVDNSTIECSSIKAHMDYTNYIISSTVTSNFFKSYETFLKDALYLVGSSEIVGRSVVDFLDPVYGSVDTSYTTYILPNFIICTAFSLAIILTSMTFILEKKNGIFDRFFITGVSMGQILVSHIIIEALIVTIQCVGFISIPVLVFNFKIEGSITLLALLTYLQGFVGMTFGLLVSTITYNENTAINIMNGVLYPLCFISGLFWPVEGFPRILRFISKLLSPTIPSEAFRSIFSRGWGMENISVVMGFVVSIAWILIHIVLIVIVHKFKK